MVNGRGSILSSLVLKLPAGAHLAGSSPRILSGFVCDFLSARDSGCNQPVWPKLAPMLTSQPWLRRARKLLFAAALFPATLGLLRAQTLPDTTRLLRFPTTNGSQIVFDYAGQLYTVDKAGGTARRLTSGPGYNSFPRFSADGGTLAFTGQYDGNTEVYTMPADGGTPKRLTTTPTLGRDDISDRMGPNNLVMTWENTKPLVVFRSRMKSFNDFIGQLYAVGPDADLPQQLPVPRGGFVSFSPDDSKMAYNQVFREFRTWKHYRGGMADDVWIYDFKTGTTENLTNNPAQDICPMWGPDNKIYYLSDRDGRMNLFSTDLGTKEVKQLTTFKDFDIKFPALGKDAIVFENAGYIWRYPLSGGAAAIVPISVKEDFAASRPALVDADKHVESVSTAPDGKRLVVVARGDVFSVPAKDGTPRDLTKGTSASHERNASWSPDGKLIAYLSDATGENEIYVRNQDGTGEPQQITHGADTYYFQPIWSPDNKKLCWSDRMDRLRFVDVASKAVTEVDRDPLHPIRDYDWSPDSQWITWARSEENSQSKVYLYGLNGGKRIEVTDGWYASGNPAFSDDGKYLLLSSGRDFKPLFGEEEFSEVYRDLERPYLVTLAKTTADPLKPLTDEVGSDDKKDDKPKDDSKKDDAKKDEPKKPVTVTVDEDGLKDRLTALPVASGNYGDLRLVDDRVFYTRTTTADAAEAGEEEGPGGVKKTLASYSLKDRKETVLGKVSSFEITHDGKKMLVKVDKDYSLVDLPKDKLDLKDKVKLSGLDVMVDHHAEWKQIYDEAWRQMRDFFYAPNMNGVNWQGMHDKYAALVPFVNDRDDLTYLIGELIAELNNGHSYTSGGERPETPRIKLGLLGAEFSRDPATRAYRIDRILPGENWQEQTRSPLTAQGLNVKEGDYILAIDGTPVSKLANLNEALIDTAGKQVTLRVNGKPTDDGARDITVVPTGSANEAPLYYLAWVRHNIDYVNQKTDGKVGYVHIPDMGQAGLNEFTKLYFPQIHKQALIIDVRGNGGGFVSPMIIERLRRALVMVEMNRNSQVGETNPPQTFIGPMVGLMDEFSASDGDIFPYRFKTLGIGKLIGKRSWGGVVGINNTLPFVDGGDLRKPEFAPYGKDGQGWVIEGHGVDPDIVVSNDPGKEFHGEDQQLDKGIEVILDELKTQEKQLPPIPPFPDRSVK